VNVCISCPKSAFLGKKNGINKHVENYIFNIIKKPLSLSQKVVFKVVHILRRRVRKCTCVCVHACVSECESKFVLCNPRFLLHLDELLLT